MEQTRFVALKNQIWDLRQKDLKTSLEVQTELDRDLTYSHSTTAFKKLHADDLPVYKKWEKGIGVWFFRLRNLKGHIICDLIKISDHFEYSQTSISLVMSEENVDSNEEEFNNAICKLITHLEK
jgi:hypothetical protein